MASQSPRRILVVGASSGLGRSLGVTFGTRGDRVALAARRVERAQQAATDAGGGSAVAIECDVGDPQDCVAVVDRAVEAFGGLDALVYCAGTNTLGQLVSADHEQWVRSLETNVIGAALVTGAAVAHLTASQGTAIYLSSISASETAPWPGLGVYITSKAALDKLVEAFAVEHPAVGFTRLAMGDCAGGPGDQATEMVNGWDPELAGHYVEVWSDLGYMNGGLIDVADLAAAVDSIISSGAHIPRFVLKPRPAGE